jgi:hypothetical protein
MRARLRRSPSASYSSRACSARTDAISVWPVRSASSDAWKARLAVSRSSATSRASAIARSRSVCAAAQRRMRRYARARQPSTSARTASAGASERSQCSSASLNSAAASGKADCL